MGPIKDNRGRKASGVTQYFTSRGDGKKECIFCGWASVAPTARCIDHVLKCRSASEAAKVHLRRERGIAAAPSTAPVMDLPNTPRATHQESENLTSPPTNSALGLPLISTSTPTASTSFLPLTHFVSSISNAQNDELQRDHARAMYCSGMAFRSVENLYWKQFLHKLNPGYRPPSSYAVANTLLKDEEAEVDRAVQRRLQASDTYITLLTDGWTDVTGKSVINYVACTPVPVFVASTQPRVAHTAQYIADDILEHAAKVGDKVVAVCTDNAANMRAAWRLINDKMPEIVTYGCASHGLNLLLHDFMELPSLKSILQTCARVPKVINNRGVVRNAFEGTTSLKLPVPTR